ncbi:MAG: DNA-3-methyladenine glycosylase I [Gammaproteobacteria bacterium]|nr:DNA-3-methyladenine glycosylase I [Gammaproteobacteria bacterium]
MPLKKNKPISRCAWANTEQVNIDYHDQEWGVPIYDDRLLFEFLILEGAQAGLSWITILKRRSQYRENFDHFDVKKIARYDEKKYQALLHNPGIIRNRLKIRAAIGNAQAYLAILESFPSFADYIWQFVDGKPIQNQWKTSNKIPVSTPQSDAMSKDLKRRDFKFVGSTICYAYMQAVGMVNDHLITCFRHKQITKFK